MQRCKTPARSLGSNHDVIGCRLGEPTSQNGVPEDLGVPEDPGVPVLGQVDFFFNVAANLSGSDGGKRCYAYDLVYGCMAAPCTFFVSPVNLYFCIMFYLFS